MGDVMIYNNDNNKIYFLGNTCFGLQEFFFVFNSKTEIQLVIYGFFQNKPKFPNLGRGHLIYVPLHFFKKNIKN